MRLECNHHRLPVPSLRSPHDLIENTPVSAVHAVEVPDAEQRGTEVAGNVVEFVEGQHPKVARLCHAERSEGSAVRGKMQIPRFARDDNF
jgi:hypothetical protein